MKLLIVVIHRTEKVEPVLNQLEHLGIRGATILNSKGMAMALENYFDGSFLGSLRAVMEPDREENRTLFMALKDEEVEEAVAAIQREVGDFSQPNTGVAFALPIAQTWGIEDK